MPPASAPIELVVFDIAGTLMDDDHLARDAYRAVLAQADLEATDEWLRSRMGRKKATVLGELLLAAGRPGADALAEDLAEAYDAAMLDLIDRRPPRALPGALEAWDACAGAGCLVAVTTGFSHEVGAAAVRALGRRPATLVGSDEVPEGRPAPDLVHEAMRRTGVRDATRVACVGDTPADLECGTAAGCGAVVGVGHGTHSLEELARHPHTHLLPTLEGLTAALGIAGT